MFYSGSRCLASTSSLLCYDVGICIRFSCGILMLLFLQSCVSGGEMASPMDDLRQLQQRRCILFNSLLIHNRASISSSSSSSSASQHHESNPHPHEPNIFAMDSHVDRGKLDPQVTNHCRLHGIDTHYSYVNNNNKQNQKMHDLNLHVDVDRDGPVRGVT